MDQKKAVTVMKADYRNWITLKQVKNYGLGMAVSLVVMILAGFAGLGMGDTLRLVVTFFAAMAAAFFFQRYRVERTRYHAFDFNSPHSVSRRIVDKIAAEIQLPDHAKVLDVGCGSGALSVAVAKKNPTAMVIGIDPFDPKADPENTKEAAEANAKAEGLKKVLFMYGNAFKVEFPDDTFDFVMSNYVYSQVPVDDRLSLVLESLRTLKKGGYFLIHDIFTPGVYGGDRDFLLRQMKKIGNIEGAFIPTDDGKFMTTEEAKKLDLTGSAMLIGKKL